MLAAPVLTVVLPVYDAAPYLPEMLTSLHRNVDAEHQVVIVDDGSRDATPQVIEEYADRIPDLQVIRHDTPRGLADARNAGLAVARGDYVTFVDGDDWLAPDYLRRLIAVITDLECDFVRVDHIQVRDRDRVPHLAPEARRNVVLDPRSGILPATRRTMVDYPYAWAGIYRRELGQLLRFPTGLHTAEDRPWIWRLHREATSYAVASLAGVFYRRLVATSLTQIGDARQLHFLDAFAGVLAQVIDEADVRPKAVRQFLAVLAHQLTLRARFTRPMRRIMRTRARTMIDALPPQLVCEAISSDSRAGVLRPVLPTHVWRMWVDTRYRRAS